MGTMSGLGVLFSVLLNYQTVIILRWQLKVKTEKRQMNFCENTQMALKITFPSLVH